MLGALTAVHSLCQGQEGARQGFQGSAFLSQEEVPTPGDGHQQPRGTLGSGHTSLDLSVVGTETSERSEWR